MSEPLQQAWMNDHVEARSRATILSVRGMAFTLGGAAGLVCLGLVARGEGIPVAWMIGAGVLLGTAPGLLWLGRLAAREPGLAASSPIRVEGPSAVPVGDDDRSDD